MAKRGAKHRTTEQQLADVQEQLNALRERARKEDTRRKIIIGSMMLSLAERDDGILDFLKRRLDERLSDRDRRLFISRDHLGLAIPGLHGATLYPAKQSGGWALGRALRPAAEPERDRHGNPVGV